MVKKWGKGFPGIEGKGFESLGLCVSQDDFNLEGATVLIT